MVETQAPIDHPPPGPGHEGGGTTAGRAIAVVLLGLCLAALLGAQSLRRVAERQPYGFGRDVALAVTKPLATMSHTMFLDRPREWFASLTDHEDPQTATVFAAPGTTVTAPSTTTTTSTTVLPAVAPATTVAPTTTLPPRRVPSPAAPLVVWMGGDSLMGTVSDQVEALLPGDPRVSFHTDVQVSTGLARPDVLDWAAELTNQMAATNPDVVVLSFGANDDQPLHPPDGSFARLYTPEWQAEYARRVGVMMDIASAGDTRTVVWLGLPNERPDHLESAKDAMNAAAQSEAAKRPGVIWVDVNPLVSGPDGAYTDDVTQPDGSVVRARQPDGVHLTEAGAALVAPAVLRSFAAEWHLA